MYREWKKIELPKEYYMRRHKKTGTFEKPNKNLRNPNM
jgi:hypothetical protein